MKESYKRDSHHNYLILETEENFQENEYPIKMMTYNQIPGLLKCDVRRMNGSISFYYEITSKQSAARIFERSGISYEDVRQILAGIKRGLEGASGYLLDENSFLIDPEHFYMDTQSGEVFLCYVPGRKGDFQKELQNLAEYILKNLDHGEEKAVILGYEVYRRVMEENSSIDDVLQLAYEEIQNCGTEKQRNFPCQDKGKESKKEYKRENRNEENADTSEDRKSQKREERQKILKKWGIRISIAAGILLLLLGIILTADSLSLDLTKVGGALSVFIALSAYTVSFIKSRQEEEKTEKRREEKRRETDNKKIRENIKRRKKQEQKKENCEEKKRGINTEAGYTGENGIIIKQENKAWMAENSFRSLEDEDEEETELLTFGETVLLETEKIKSEKKLVSLEKEKSPDICISCSSMIVGKIRQQADFVLDDEHISRVHARIEKNGDDVYVMDLNSTNGTFVNGERLQENERRRLQPLDKVAFASIVYEYETKHE
ncbi:MAG: DUF6382 domain-containing protein [Eubacteriales bacterium]|nr:DUF6382 domain-containing protein [Eubacteriales bacterium]